MSNRARPMRAVERLAPFRLAKVWADNAANALYDRDPILSARFGLTRGQTFGLLGIGALLAICFTLKPNESWVALQLVSVGYFSALIAFRLLTGIAAPYSAPRKALSEDALPVVTILAPVYREHRILPQLTAALSRMNYPASKMDIKIVLEAEDRETIRLARDRVFDSRFELIIVPAGTPRTKPRALNYALRFARGSIVTVYDAEDIPHPDQLRIAAEIFAAGDDLLACVQSPLNWYNGEHSWLTRQFVLEYANQFLAILPFLARLGWPIPLGGTSNHFKRECLESVGGWDAYNVTEDADLGFRLARKGYRCETSAPATLEEAPENLNAWLKQRTRWLKGYIQTLAVQLRQPQKLSSKLQASLALTVGAATLSAFIHLPILLLAGALIAAGQLQGSLVEALGLLSCGYAASMFSAFMAMKRGGLSVRITDLALMPAYWPLQTIAAVCALAELRFRPYFWAKTEHGFSLAPEV